MKVVLPEEEGVVLRCLGNCTLVKHFVMPRIISINRGKHLRNTLKDIYTHTRTQLQLKREKLY